VEAARDPPAAVLAGDLPVHPGALRATADATAGTATVTATGIVTAIETGGVLGGLPDREVHTSSEHPPGNAGSMSRCTLD
jgi:hypothetical protein